jgi:GDP-mannose 6-dehydrogenase
MGANKDYIDKHIPHIAELMVASPQEVTNSSGTIVIGNNDPEFRQLLTALKPGQRVVDLVRAMHDRRSDQAYQGICW